MKIMKTVQVPASTRDVVDKVVCDLCKRNIPNEGSYEVNEVTVSHKTGSSYPEGGSGEKVRVDLCPSCFDEKLIPWLTSQGVEPTTEEWEF